jgi:hypothetical protein
MFEYLGVEDGIGRGVRERKLVGGSNHIGLERMLVYRTLPVGGDVPAVSRQLPVGGVAGADVD